MRAPEATTSRLLVSHALAATAMATPWPALLLATWAATHSEVWLGVVGAARMAPYVALSWLAGALGDRVPRLRLFRLVTVARFPLLGACAVLLHSGHVATAVVVATLTVAAGTPAYPAVVAALPALAGARTRRLTELFVTAEVSAFVVGPAIGGLLLGVLDTSGTVLVAVALAGAAVIALPAPLAGPAQAVARVSAPVSMHSLARSPGFRTALHLVVLVNAVEAAVGLCLVTLAHEAWHGDGRTYGIAAAALGLGALAAPAVALTARRPGPALLLTGGAVAAAATAPHLAWALLPLALVGAAGTQVECAATALLQTCVPDERRAFALGIADMSMVSAAFVAAGLAPALSAALGPHMLLACLAAVTVTGALLVSGRRAVTAPPAARPRMGP